MLSIISRPTPGMANTVSVMTAPPTSEPVCSPSKVTVEIQALRSTWRPSTSRRGKPFATAKPTYSARITSISWSRRLRSRIADRLSANVSAGKNR